MNSNNNAPLLGEAAPHSIDAEQWVLGGLLIDSDKLRDVSQLITADDFYVNNHQLIFAAVISLADNAKPIDLLSVCNQLDEQGQGDTVGGIAYLGEIAKNCCSTANISAHAKIIKDKSTRRKHIAACNMAAEAGYKGDSQAFAESLASLRNAVDDAEMDASITSSRLEMCTGSDGFDLDTDWLIDGWLPEQCFGVIYGASGSYKSFHVLDWCCSIASGRKWSGHDVEQGAVLYVAGEGAMGIGRRIKAWEIINQTTATYLYRPSGINDVTEAKQRAMIISACQNIEENTGKKVHAIVFDTLNRVFGAGNENESRDMTAFVNACESIKRKAECTVIAVHHTGKDATRGGRGSSVLYAALDFEFCVQKTTDKHYKIKATKAKDSDDSNELEFGLSLVGLGVKDKKGRDRMSLARSGGGFTARKVDPKLCEIVQWLSGVGVNEYEGSSYPFLKDKYSFEQKKLDPTQTDDAIRKRFSRKINDAIRENYIRQDDRKDIFLVGGGVSEQFNDDGF